VEAITVRKTMIRADDGTLHVVPNRVLDAAAYSVKSQPLSSPSMGKE
jgi:small-conductance mechanosensitive channel